MPVPVTCDECGETDTYPPSKAERRRFCSMKCRKEWQAKQRVELTCENCGETDTYPANQADSRQFCSTECKGEWQSSHVTGTDHPNWDGGKDTFICDNCGEKGQRKSSEIGERNFCDPSCKGEWMSKHRTGENHPQNTQKLVECAWCGDEISRPRWQRKQYDQNFCDDECRWNYFSEHGDKIGRDSEKVEFECDYCGDANKRIRSEVITYEHNFCNRECRGNWFAENQTGKDHPNWKGGVGSYYGENWNRIRREVRERDRHKCFFCGVSDGAAKMIHGAELHVHHVRRKDDFESAEKSNSLSNLMALCAFCHQRIF